MMSYTLTASITLASLLVYFWTMVNAGKARNTFGVSAPSMDGPPAFLAAQRVQANTIEQMVPFFPALWLCATFLGDRWAFAGGLLWVIGRIVYALGYYRNPKQRAPGFILTLIASAYLMLGTLAGLILHA